jgi:hypothetical protein
MSKLFRRWIYICLLLAAVFAYSGVAFAQSTRGELAGNISDSSGALVPGAKIVATGIDTGITSETISTSSGSYHFTELAVGRYNVTVTAAGFATSTSTGVQITINSTTALNIKLSTGGANETITVDASAPAVESESSEVGGTVSQQQIEDLPLSLAAGVGGLRSPETFVFLVPGTTGPGSGGPTGTNSNGVFLGKLSGGQSYGAEVLLDGSSITRSENGSSFDETSPTIEALQEFKVTTSTPSAEYGHTTAGFESFTTKSGTNEFHGTAYTIIKNAAMDANTWFNNGYLKYYDCPLGNTGCSGYVRQKDSKFDYGGTFGGPVRIPKLYNGRDRTFFFFAWEQYKLHIGQTQTATVPTTTGGTTGLGERGGDFSAILGGATSVINPCTGEAVLQNQIFDPATTQVGAGGVLCRLPFAGNIVPTARFSKTAAALVAALPAPNQTPTANPPYGFINNYAGSVVNPNENTTYTIRGDHSLSDKSKLFGSYSSRDNFSVQTFAALPAPYRNSGYPQDFQTHYGRAGWDYALTPTLLNHLNLGYNRTNSKNFSYNIGSKVTLTSAGAPNFYSNAFPLVGWDGLDAFSGWGVGQNGDNIDNGIRVNDSVSWQKGRHSFKFGVDWRHQQYSIINVSIPTVNFLRSETDVAALGGTPQFQSGNSFASFLLGEVDNSGQTVYNNHPQWNSHYIAGFFEDDFKLTPNLTVNLGIRYDIDAPRTEAHNDTSAFSFTAPDSAAGGLPGALMFGKTCHCNSAWADTWYKDIAPRIGFAYLLPGTNGKAVLRGGGSIIYGPLQYADFGGGMTQGYTQSRSIGSNYTGVGTAAGFTPAFQLDSGYSAWTASDFAPSTDPTQLTAEGGPGSFTAVGGEVILPNEGRPSMTSNWSLQLQDELAQDLIFTIGYIGQTAQNLRSGDLSNFNNIDPKYFSLGDHLGDTGNVIPLGGSSTFTPEGGAQMTVNAPYSTFTGNVGQALRPYPQYDYIQGDCCLENLGHSSYHAMVVSLNRRFRQGFNLQVAYTWSKNETDADSAVPFSYDSNRSQAQNATDLRAEKAVSIQNIPQQLSISYLYQLPFGKGRKFLNNNRLLDLAVGGWEIGAIQRYSSGQPLDFGCATAASYYQNCFRFTRGAGAAGGFASAAYKQNKNHPSFFNGQSWFKPAFRPAGVNSASDTGVPLSEAAFVDMNREGKASYANDYWLRTPSPSCADGCSYDPFVFGTGIPRVTEEITGPLWKSEDFSLIKNFNITAKTKFQLKGEAIDAFNRHRMGMPDVAPGDSASATGFGIPTYTDYGPRNIQVTGRITF